MNDNSKLELCKGQRLRTAGTTYEVTEDAKVPAGMVPVKPQSTRLLKTVCTICGYTCRVTKRWIDSAGTPICPTDNRPMAVVESKKKAAVAPSPIKVPFVGPETATTYAPVEDETEPDEPEFYGEDEEPEEEPVEPPVKSESPLAHLLSEL